MTVYGIQFWIECKGGLKTADELSDALDDLVYDGNLSLGYSNHSIMGAGLFMKNAVQNNFESIREILNEFADKIKYVSEWDYEDSSDIKWGVHILGESKKSARKSIKESSVGYYIYSKPLGDKYAYCDKSKFTEEGFYLIEDYMLDAIHIFETEKEAQKFIDKYAKHFMVDEDNIIIAEYPSNKLGFFESKKSIKESHGFDEENEYMLGLSVVTNESLIEDTLEEDGLEIDWDYISKVSSELDYAIERKFAKEIGHVAVEEFHDDNSYNCTFWVRFDDIKANKYMKNLNYFDDYTRGNSTVFMYDVDEILDNEIDKLEKKYDSDILGILRECVTVEIEVPTESVFEENKKSARKSIKNL